MTQNTNLDKFKVDIPQAGGKSWDEQRWTVRLEALQEMIGITQSVIENTVKEELSIFSFCKSDKFLTKGVGKLKLPKTIVKKFSKNGIRLSEEAALSFNKTQREWHIEDGEITYVITRAKLVKKDEPNKCKFNVMYKEIDDKANGLRNWLEKEGFSDNDVYKKFIRDFVHALEGDESAELKDDPNASLIYFSVVSPIYHAIASHIDLLLKAEALTGILKDLREFSKMAFEFFYGGFYQAKQSPDEMPEALPDLLNHVLRDSRFVSEKYAPNYVLGTLFRQISTDLEIVNQAFYQRSRYTDPRNQDPSSVSHDFADMLANLALKPALKAGYFGDQYKQVLTYRTDKIGVRLVPYNDVVLLGIPFACRTELIRPIEANAEDSKDEDSKSAPKSSYRFSVPTELLAMPHEIGHHLFEFGKLQWKNKKVAINKIVQLHLREKLAADPAKMSESVWKIQWVEELFADAYGCIVAGPISVFGFQEYLAAGQPPYYDEHLSEHPFPALRPLIQTQILRSMTDQFGNPVFGAELDALDTYWQQWVAQHWTQWLDRQWPYGYGDQVDLLRDATYQINERVMTGHEILAELQDVIDVILNTLHTLVDNYSDSTWTPNWVPQTYPDEDSIAKLYRHFVLNGLKIVLLDDYEKVHNRTQKVPQAISTHTWLKERLKELAAEPNQKSGMDMLVELVLLEGWSTEGPTDVGHGSGGG